MEDFKIETWGSRYTNVLILYPEKVNLIDFTKRNGIVDLGFAKIKVEKNDSNRNVERRIKFIEVKDNVIVQEEGKSSVRRHFERFYLVDKNLTIKEINPEIYIKKEKIENESAIKNEEVKYFMYNDKEIEISRRLLAFKKKRLTVTLHKFSGIIYAVGDTFYIKENLKELGFTWNRINKTWEISNVDVDDIKEKLSKIENLTIDFIDDEKELKKKAKSYLFNIK